VPFYQKRWSEYGIDIDLIKDFNDFSKLPYTTKEDIIRFSKEMIPTIYDIKNLILASTGGTTDSKAFFYKTKEAIGKEYAFFLRYWFWHKYNFFIDDCVIFRGSWNRPQKPINKFYNLHYFSSFDIDYQRIEEYINHIYKYKIKFIQAYPSFAYLLFKFAYDNKMIDKLLHIKAVFCSSEAIYKYQKDFIENNFGIKVFTHYGHGEMGALFQQCEYNDAYHIIQEYGYTEFAPVNNSEYYEIITTGFNNLGTPLIRYRTKDYVKLKEDEKCLCGLNYPKIVKEIEGRSGDFIITKKGKLIGPSHLEFFLKGEMTSFLDIQFIQDSIDHLTIFIVPSSTYKEDDKKILYERVIWRIGENINIDIYVVDKIERPINQKKRLIISKINM